MKVGDYVRTNVERLNIQQICKIKKILSDDFIFTDRGYYDKEYIIKSSTNITDLILPMDLMYIDISPDNCGGIVVPRIPETYCELNQIINEIKLGNYILKGIVTKEQLMENMYKVESEVK